MRLGHTTVAVVRDEDGDVHAVDDTCSHANVSLSEGEVDGCTIECWLHGSRFDLRTGEPTVPAGDPPGRRLPRTRSRTAPSSSTWTRR